MPTPELILLTGPPGSGKSSIADKFVELGLVMGTRHLDIGNLKRSIDAGERPSVWAELLRQKEHPNRITGAAPSEAMSGIFEEYILEHPEGLTIVSGYPRYMDRVAPFRESVSKLGARVMALCVVEANETVLINRLNARIERPGQKLKDPVARLKDHETNILPTIEVLAQDYPHYTLDGELPLNVNAGVLLGIYKACSARQMPLEA